MKNQYEIIEKNNRFILRDKKEIYMITDNIEQAKEQIKILKKLGEKK